MKRLDLRAWSPPGFPYQAELGMFFWGLLLSFFNSLRFFASFFEQRANILHAIRLSHTPPILPDFSTFVRETQPWLGYGVLALVMVGCILWNYGYHRQDSKSVYLMRRLPDHWEYHRRCLAIPLVCLALCLLLCLATLAVCGLVYETYAPELYLLS